MSKTNERRRLNNMHNSNWLKFTKTWFVHRSSPRQSRLMHPATFPTSLVEDFIRFFTKPNDWVIDPFNGIGSTSIAARRLNRNSLGIELYPYFVKFAKKELSALPGKTKNIIYKGDCRKHLNLLGKKWNEKMNFCITSPPYWCQLTKNAERNHNREVGGLRTLYGNDTSDLGNIIGYERFLGEQELIFKKLNRLMKFNSYIVVVTNNVYRDGKLHPLAFDTFNSMSKFWTPKDEKIWCQNDKKLFPFGMTTAYVGNRSHHYCLIFRKE